MKIIIGDHHNDTIDFSQLTLRQTCARNQKTHRYQSGVLGHMKNRQSQKQKCGAHMEKNQRPWLYVKKRIIPSWKGAQWKSAL